MNCPGRKLAPVVEDIKRQNNANILATELHRFSEHIKKTYRYATILLSISELISLIIKFVPLHSQQPVRQLQHTQAAT